MAGNDPFDQWVPADYLREYYSEVQQDEKHTIRYFVEQIRTARPGPLLCFGCGPAVHHVFLAAQHATEITMADYLPRNLQAVDDWRQGVAGAHDWSEFVRYTLECEGIVVPDDTQVRERMDETRRKIVRLLPADAALADPLGRSFRGRFATVVSAYCADSATGDKAVWRTYSRNIASLVEPGGLFLVAALHRCRQYRVGERLFSSANIDELDMGSVMALDFRPDSISVKVQDVPDHGEQGFKAVLHARGVKA
jgi:hypothetical protein